MANARKGVASECVGNADADGRRHLVPALPHVTELLAVRDEGPFLFDAGGQRYLDFTAGIAVTTTGHCYPKVVAAVKDQAGRLLHGQVCQTPF